MHAARGGRAFAGDHAVTHDGQRYGCIGDNRRGLDRLDQRGKLAGRTVHVTQHFQNSPCPFLADSIQVSPEQPMNRRQPGGADLPKWFPIWS
jgi:hypothetical protein